MFTSINFAEMSDIQEIGLAAAASPEFMAKALQELFNIDTKAADERDNSRRSDSEVGVAEAV
jgi:hypothetical protein